MMCHVAYCTTFAEHDVALWKGLEPTFMKHVDQVNARLKAAGLPLLVQGN